jgi:predicted flap endonuclease-1-like 5' DNA nuclease
MGRLTDDMTRLRGDTDALRHTRQGFIIDLKEDVAGIKAEVATMQAGFRQDLDEMAEKLHVGRQDFIEDLGNFMAELKTEVSGMTTGFYNDRKEMAKETKAVREQFVADIRTAVTDLRNEAGALIADFRNNHDQMGVNLHADLDEFSSNLQTAVDDMIAGFCSKRVEMAGEAKTTRQEFVTDIIRAVDDLKQKNATLRAEFAADISGARQAWSGDFTNTCKAEMKVGGEEKKIFEPPAKEESVSKEAATSQAEQEPGPEQTEGSAAAASKDEILKTKVEIVRDDLTQIKGIGVGRETQLNIGGIYTFAQLANCTIDTLNDILGAEGARLAPVEKWIEKAKNLLSSA